VVFIVAQRPGVLRCWGL